jgi:hypothetical protein
MGNCPAFFKCPTMNEKKISLNRGYLKIPVNIGEKIRPGFILGFAAPPNTLQKITPGMITCIPASYSR